MLNLSGRNVLLVEDDIELAAAMQDILLESGATVAMATEFEDGFAAAVAFDFDFALLDINLGGRTCEPIARVLEQKHTPFIFVTGEDCPPETFPTAPILRKPYRSSTMELLIAVVLPERVRALRMTTRH